MSPEFPETPLAWGQNESTIDGLLDSDAERTKFCCRALDEGQPHGNIHINGRSLDDYFRVVERRMDVLKPFAVTHTIGSFNIRARVHGGGLTGQAQV